MNLVKVFRIETCLSDIEEKERSHIGFFCGRLQLNNFLEKSIANLYSNRIGQKLGYFPEPEEDGMPNFTFNHIFGFCDVEQIMSLNVPLMRELTNSGYIITEYEVDKKYVVYGKSQVAFMQNHAKLLRIVNDPLNFVRQMRKERRDQYYGL